MNQLSTKSQIKCKFPKIYRRETSKADFQTLVLVLTQCNYKGPCWSIVVIRGDETIVVVVGVVVIVFEHEPDEERIPQL